LGVGVDPKTIVCEFFKAGNCTKGDKCRYSHNVAVERKVNKINLYVDARDKDETMEDWDQEKLEDAVKTNSNVRPENETSIICKHFLDAIESQKYGYFWTCPNGGNECKYKHCLPLGFVLKTKEDEEKKKEAAMQDDGKLAMELIDEERRKLDVTKCRPLTLELFNDWKKARTIRKAKEAEKKRVEANKKGGGFKGVNVLSGRELFKFDPSMFVDDDDADDEVYERPEDPMDEEKQQGPLGDGNVDVDYDPSMFAGGDDLPGDASSSSAAKVGVDESLFADDDDDLED
jgi:hypothetical protein